MKKFVETKSKAPFDWNQFLAKNCKNMSVKELRKVLKLSKSWVTCACGNQCVIIPRTKKTSDDGNLGQPLDDKLSDLGSNFHSEGIYEMVRCMENYHSVSNSSFFAEEDKKEYLKEANEYRIKAKNILRNIEKRSAVLIKEEFNRAKDVLTQFGYTVKKVK